MTSAAWASEREACGMRRVREVVWKKHISFFPFLFGNFEDIGLGPWAFVRKGKSPLRFSPDIIGCRKIYWKYGLVYLAAAATLRQVHKGTLLSLLKRLKYKNMKFSNAPYAHSGTSSQTIYSYKITMILIEGSRRITFKNKISVVCLVSPGAPPRPLWPLPLPPSPPPPQQPWRAGAAAGGERPCCNQKIIILKMMPQKVSFFRIWEHWLSFPILWYIVL